MQDKDWLINIIYPYFKRYIMYLIFFVYFLKFFKNFIKQIDTITRITWSFKFKNFESFRYKYKFMLIYS